MLGGTPQRPRPAFYAPARQRLWDRLLSRVERRVKRTLYNCQSCGNCLLDKSVFICPMTCSRGLRNGPCRGSTRDRCFVDQTRACTWFRIYQRAEHHNVLDRLLEINAPRDHQLSDAGISPHSDGVEPQRSHGPHLPDLLRNWVRLNPDCEGFRTAQRQPAWWQGDSRYHPPAYAEPLSKLEAALASGRFVVSAEVAPPMEPSGDRIVQVVGFLKGHVDTVNFTDNPRGVARMSGLACALHSLKEEMEPVLQIQTRHRGRHDVESEAVGAAVVGVHNVLCLGDDTGRLGPGPAPRPEWGDLDPVQALWMLRRLRDEGVNGDGEPIEHRPRYFLGGMASPYAALPRYEAIVTEKKINAGAQFLQTMPVFDVDRFGEWMEALDKRDLLGKVYLIPTVAPLKSAWHARFMANEVPGVHIPATTRARVENATDPQEEGIEIALETVAKLIGIEWVHGLHILAPEQEELVPRLVRESGLKDFAPDVETDPGNGHSKSSSGHSVKRNSSQFVSSQARDIDNS